VILQGKLYERRKDMFLHFCSTFFPSEVIGENSAGVMVKKYGWEQQIIESDRMPMEGLGKKG
jgi:hypothetical protein